MKLVDLDGMRVIARESGERVATARSVVIDARNAQVRAVTVADGDKRLIDWTHVVAAGADATVIDSADALRAPSTEAEAHALHVAESLLGKRVLTTEGRAIGCLEDLVVDSSGCLTELRAGGDAHPGTDVVAIGAFAVVVKADTDDTGVR